MATTKKTSGAKILIATKISGLVILVAVHKLSHILCAETFTEHENDNFRSL